MCKAFIVPALVCSFAVPAAIPASAADTKETGAADNASGTAAADSASDTSAAAASVTVPELILSKCYLLESDNYENIADGYYQAVLLTEESAKSFPALSSGLDAVNTRITASCKETFKELSEGSKEFNASNKKDGAPVPATLEYSIIPTRMDDKVVSFITSCYSYLPGAAHGMTVFEGITLDVSTGKEVTLDQVVKDKRALVGAINENLRFLSTGEPAGDREESISEALASVDYFPSWVISDGGVIFRFDPSSIGAYAEGALQAEVSFAKYPDLFTDAYGPHVGSFVYPVDTFYPTIVDLNGDGTYEQVSLNARPNESENMTSYTALRVAVGDKECLRETYFFNAKGYLLHTQSSKNYLYVQTITDNDYRIFSVFDLSGEKPVFVGELNGTGFTSRYRRENETSDIWYLDEQLISSPDSFTLDSHMDLMSTYSATRRYKVGDDGMPVPLTEDYEISSDLVLTALTDLPGDIVDPSTGAVTKKSATLPKGAKCRLYRTNGKDTVDVITEDGTVYRFSVTETWPQKVNGLRLDEAFDGIMFAG
jgi:hypothetical protein